MTSNPYLTLEVFHTHSYGTNNRDVVRMQYCSRNKPDCGDDDDCRDPWGRCWCNFEILQCQSRKPGGSTCNNDHECVTLACVDGTCTETKDFLEECTSDNECTNFYTIFEDDLGSSCAVAADGSKICCPDHSKCGTCNNDADCYRCGKCVEDLFLGSKVCVYNCDYDLCGQVCDEGVCDNKSFNGTEVCAFPLEEIAVSVADGSDDVCFESYY